MRFMTVRDCRGRPVNVPIDRVIGISEDFSGTYQATLLFAGGGKMVVNQRAIEIMRLMGGSCVVSGDDTAEHCETVATNGGEDA